MKPAMVFLLGLGLAGLSAGRLAAARARRATSDAESLLAEQRALIARIAHDLRSPLTVIRANSQLMLRRRHTVSDGAADEPHLRSIIHQTERLIAMVESLGVLAEFEIGELRPEPSEHNLVVLAAEAIERLALTSEQHQLRLESTGTAPALVDGAILARVFDNLIGNALKYSPGGEVLVRIEAQDGLVRVSIRDQGAGIPVEVRDALRRGRARPQGTRRLGLGLRIAREGIAAHQGELVIESEAGRGSTVTFTLPLAGSHRAPAVHAPALPWDGTSSGGAASSAPTAVAL